MTPQEKLCNSCYNNKCLCRTCQGAYKDGIIRNCSIMGCLYDENNSICTAYVDLSGYSELFENDSKRIATMYYHMWN